MRNHRLLLLGALALLGTVAACDGPNDPASGRVAISLGTLPNSLAKANRPGLAAGSETFMLGDDTLVVNSVELVLKHVEFDTQDDSTLCNMEGEGEFEGDCNELEVGPLLADLPLGGGIARLFTVPVPAGTYEELEFLIHKPGMGGEDAAFVAAHPAFQGISIRVTGLFNGQPFTFTSRVTAHQEQEFPTPVVVAANTPLDVTILVDVSGWFVDETGTQFVDPATALPGQPNEHQVSDNIRRSFKAFRDQDGDCHEDD